MNTLFRIAFGDYEFVLDRTTLTYSLTETVTKTVWATELSLGWIEIKDRATGAITRTDFGDCKLISIAEKMGAAGKRILLGLDAPSGVPIDIYLICGSKDIQLTVEASRDSKTHLLERVGLLPGLCHAEQGGYLVLPQGEGILVPADTSAHLDSRVLPIWNPLTGLLMPFIGATAPGTALALLTDSAYGEAHLTQKEGLLCANFVYERDPERRRLDIRVVPLPKGNYISIAQAYREKLIGERNHQTFRKKLREKPKLEEYLGITHPEIPDTGVELQSGLHTEINRWEFMETQLTQAEGQQLVITGAGDWAYFAADAWMHKLRPDFPETSIPVPLFSVVYRDSILLYTYQVVLSSILRMKPIFLLFERETPEARLLADLHALTFPAFLTAHKFLTPDFLVEEAFYSDKTRVVINKSETETYETDDLLLPPGGFYVRHPQFEAHDALRVRTVDFPKRAWRVRRSLDGKPLEQSEQIEEREFEVNG
ncbi:hypothetical protein [Armatimonas sp.]|uniref:hypothetical protein n=1 Tax=Armatimonas sp. TaxID=1872638 RepID=UPI00286AF8E5|nr:hypothetical protein [Armatimonas sp.]